MTTELMLDPTFSARLCLTLLHSLWQMSLLAAVAWGIARLSRRRSVERSYAIHVAALIAGLAALPVTFALVDVALPPEVVQTRLAVSHVPSTTPSPATILTPMPAATGELAQLSEAGVIPPVNIPVVAASRTGTTGADSASDSAAVWATVATWTVALYTLGVLLMLARLISGLWHARRLAVKARPLHGGPVADLLHSLARQWSMRITPALALAEQIVVPQVAGLLRPTILLPASAVTGLSADELQMILAHELAHIRRHDLWVNLLQRLAETVLFFNPALWYLNRRVSSLREFCCDELTCREVFAAAVSHPAPSGDSHPPLATDPRTPDPRTRYATALLRVAELSRPTPADPQSTPTPDPSELATLAASGRSPSELRRRIAHLFGEPIHEPLRLSRGGVLMLVTCVFFLFVGPVVWHSQFDSNIAISADEVEETERTLHFPDDRALGMLFTRPAADGDFGFEGNSWEEWQELALATGAVTVPAGQHVRLDVSRAASTDLRPLAELPPDAIQFLSLRSTDVTDDGLEPVGHLTDLRFLDLDSTRITDEGASHLANLHQLQTLKLSAFDVHLQGYGVGDAAMKVVARLPALESIDLRRTKITDEGLATLAMCQTLRGVGLDETAVTDAGLKHLKKMPNLRWLSLRVYRGESTITDEGTATLAQIPSLRFLDLSGTRITDEGLRHLAVLTKLKRLSIDKTQVTEEGLVHLAKMQDLENLYVYNTITDESVPHISRLKGLKQLSANLEISDESVALLAALPLLEYLSLSGPRITDKALEDIAQMPSLTSLWFQGCSITDRGLARLRNSRNLEHLMIWRTNVTTAGLRHLMTLPKLNHLDLKLKTEPKPNWEHLKWFAQVRDLRLNGPSIRNADLAHLQGLTELTQLNLQMDEPLDDTGIAFLEPLTNLKNVWINHSVVTDKGLVSLSRMTDLERLNLSCLATDRGLLALSKLNSLHFLQIASPYVSKEGIAALGKQLPSLQDVNHYEYRLDHTDISVSRNDPLFRRGEPDERPPKDALENKLPPPLTVENWLNTDGKTLTLADLHGKVVLINFWGARIGSSRMKLPAQKQLYEKYHDQGLEIIGVHMTWEAESLNAAIQQQGIGWPVCADVDEKTVAAWQVDGYPGYYLIDRTGTLRYADIYHGHLETAVQALLAEQADGSVRNSPDDSRDAEPAATVQDTENVIHLNVIIAQHVMLLEGREIMTWEQLEERIAALPDSSLAHPHFYVTRGAREAGTGKLAKDRMWNLHRKYALKGRSQGSLWPRSDLRYDRIETAADLVPDESLRVEGRVVDQQGEAVAGAEVLLVTPVDDSIAYKSYHIALVEGRVRNSLEHVMTHSDDAGEFVFYPPADGPYYVFAVHPDAGFALTANGQFIKDRRVQLRNWAGLVSEFGKEPEEQQASLTTHVPEYDGRPEISINQYWSDLKRKEPTLLFDFTHVPPFLETTISRTFLDKEGVSFSLPGASVQLHTGETRRIDFGPLSDQQRERLNRLRQRNR